MGNEAGDVPGNPLLVAILYDFFYIITDWVANLVYPAVIRTDGGGYSWQ